MDNTEGVAMNKAFVFSTTAFLLIIPAALLAASFLQIVKSGDDATALSVRSDVTLYTYKNARAGFNKASCSFFLLSGSDTSAIIGNLSDEWAQSIEANYTGVNITIDTSKINVTYDSDENSIRIGNIDDMNDGIPINITYQNTTIEGKLGPLEIASDCDVVTPGGEPGEESPFVTLFLVDTDKLSFDEGTGDADSSFVNLGEGDSATFTIDPLYDAMQFNITGSIDIYLYLDPIVDPPKYPDITVSLECGLCNPSVLATLTEDEISNDTAGWYVFTITPASGTVIPKLSNLTLTLSVADTPGGVVGIKVFYDSATYNSALSIPGNASIPDETAPTFSGLVSASDRVAGGAINLYWDAATDISEPITYYIYVSSTADFNYDFENYTTQNSYYNATGLTNGQWYNFVVRAQDAASNMETNTVDKSATPTGATYTETLYSEGNSSGSDDIFDRSILFKDDNKKVIVDQGEIETAYFDDPIAVVTDVTSCVIYWVDEVTVTAGPPNTANRTVDMGDGSSWDWGTFGPAEPTGTEATYSLNLTTYFTDTSPNDQTDINDIQLRYTSNDASGVVDFWWDHVYIDITYTSP